MYQSFAEVYDDLMDEIPYDMWFERLHDYMTSHGKKDGCLCELGCGTGTMTGLFCDAGYEVIGVDLSADMLTLAEQKRKETQKILYLNQNMIDFSLHKPADVILCICDSLNYLLDEEEVLSAFQCVRKHLKKDGLFIFDVKTEYCFQEIMGDLTRVEDTEDSTIIWDNLYDPEDKMNEYLITIFQKNESDECYHRFEECHTQRAYKPDELRQLIKKAGLSIVDMFGEDMSSPPGQQDERWYIVTERDNTY